MFYIVLLFTMRECSLYWFYRHVSGFCALPLMFKWSPYPRQIGEHVMLCWITVGRSGRCPRSRSDRRRSRKSCARATRAASSRRRPEHSCLAPSTAGPPTPHGTCKTGGRSLRRDGRQLANPRHTTLARQFRFTNTLENVTTTTAAAATTTIRYDTRC